MRFLMIAVMGLFFAAAPAWALPTQTFEGQVISARGGVLRLDVAGDTVEVFGSQKMLEKLEPGDRVRVTAEPQLRADDVVPLEGAFAGDKMIGRIEKIGQHTILVKTNRGYERVQVDPSIVPTLREGQAVMIELSEAPSEAESWRVRKIRPVG
jgi:hypothetical protein